MYPKDYPDYAKTPNVPTCMQEASTATQELFRQVKDIKAVLYTHGMAPNWPDLQWEIPFSDGQLFAVITKLIVDVQQIKFLLIHHGLASENDMVPLTPRWRIDGHAQHYRNVKIFEQCVRTIIQQVKEHRPEGSFTYLVDKILGQDAEGRKVK